MRIGHETLRACGLVLAACAALLAAGSASAVTIVNSYSFTQGGYAVLVRTSIPVTGPGTLSGTFTGEVNPLGRIELSNLSAFSLFFSAPTANGTSAGQVGRLGDLTLFSLNVATGGDLLIIDQSRFDATCVGAAATLAAACNPTGTNPAGTFGVAVSLIPAPGVVTFRTTQAPVVTLLSSVTIPDIMPGPVVTPGAVPEPSAWAMMITGFGLVGGALRRRRKTGAGSPAIA